MVIKPLLLGLGLYIPFIDCADMLIRLYRRSRLHRRGKTVCPTSIGQTPSVAGNGQDSRLLKPYKILISVYNIAGTFKEFRSNIARFGYDNVFIIDDASTDATPRLLKEDGIPFMSNEVNLNKPASIYKALKKLPPEIETVAVADPDAVLLNLNPREHHKTISDFDEVLSAFQASDYDACAVRILVACDSFLEYLQNFEYKISMGLARKSLGDFCAVSGAFAFFKRRCLEDVLRQHSVSIYGEDYESSLRILASGGRIYYDGRLTIVTKQRSTLADLTRQRMGWDLSLLKIHYLLRDQLKKLPKKVFSFYQYLFYNTFISIFLHPFRVLSCGLVLFSLVNLIDNVTGLNAITDNAITSPLYFLYFYISYILVAYAFLIAVERRRVDRYMFKLPAFPFYVLYINLVPRTLGFLNFAAVSFFKKKLIEDGYKFSENSNENGVLKRS